MITELRKEEINILDNITDTSKITAGAYNIRLNGKLHSKNNSDNIIIESKKDVEGIDIKISGNCNDEVVFIPVIVSEDNLVDKVYNDFYIENNANVTIYAGCGIHNNCETTNEHSGIHRFYVGKNAKVKYIENHYGTGEGTGDKILNPITEIYLEEGSKLEMITTQIEGVDSTIRKTIAKLKKDSTLVVRENIKTHGKQFAKTLFDVILDEENSSCHLVSRAVATDDSVQEFYSKLVGNTKCYAHSECDAILEGNGVALADPTVIANSVDAMLIHEATIGKIAGEQLQKLMTLGLNEDEAVSYIINGFLK